MDFAQLEMVKELKKSSMINEEYKDEIYNNLTKNA
jgi:hypothetical protein